MRSVLGTILDPAADKTLMTTLTVTLAMKGMLPRCVALFSCHCINELMVPARQSSPTSGDYTG